MSVSGAVSWTRATAQSVRNGVLEPYLEPWGKVVQHVLLAKVLLLRPPKVKVVEDLGQGEAGRATRRPVSVEPWRHRPASAATAAAAHRRFKER